MVLGDQLGRSPELQVQASLRAYPQERSGHHLLQRSHHLIQPRIGLVLLVRHEPGQRNLRDEVLQRVRLQS